eukprot:COSAG05_NODE_195_length_14550_cov_203.233686_6_plen_65_part_00
MYDGCMGLTAREATPAGAPFQRAWAPLLSICSAIENFRACASKRASERAFRLTHNTDAAYPIPD